jgi:AAA domain
VGAAEVLQEFSCVLGHVPRREGWEFHGRAVHQGTVVYCAFEGGHGFRKRKEALRREHKVGEEEEVPLYIMPGMANLINDHRALVEDLRYQLGEVTPVAVVLDTLNKSLVGSESKDVDMSNYIRAAEVIRDAFQCVVVIVHHCGLDETRPRGHSSLPGAVDAQIAVTRQDMTVTAEVEFMRDGPEGTIVAGRAKIVPVGFDINGRELSSLVVEPVDGAEMPHRPVGKRWPTSLKVFQR